MSPLLLVVLTATAARQVHLPPDYHEWQESRAIEQVIEADRKAILDRWYSERDFHLVLRAGVQGGMFNGGTSNFDHAAVQLGLGFSRRIAQRYAFQGGLTVGSGLATESTEGLLRRRGPLFDTSADVTLRIGSKRFYFGLGPFGRIWRVFEEGERFRIGGGATWEFGFLDGDDREIDLGLRWNAGLYRRDDGIDYWMALALSAGWHL